MTPESRAVIRHGWLSIRDQALTALGGLSEFTIGVVHAGVEVPLTYRVLTDGEAPGNWRVECEGIVVDRRRWPE